MAQTQAQAQAPMQISLKQISSELSKVINVYAQVFVGRERTVRLIILALISKQHIYMISPPGTGKTMMEAVARSFGMKVFYYLYNYDVKLEDILYNPIIRKVLVEGGEKIVVEYELKDPGLGTCDIHFADEMFKAPTAVLNALLGAMNERRVTLGNKEFRIPLWTLVAASNELPEKADALLDRFLFRDFLRYLPEERWYEYLIQYWNIHQPGYQRVRVNVPRIVLEAAHRAMWSVDIFAILDDYLKLLRELKERSIVVSDRRKGRILQAIAASAVLDGRDTAAPEDLEVLLYTVPTTEDEKDVVAKILDNYLGGLLRTREELEKLAMQLRQMLANIRKYSAEELAEILNDTIPRVKSKVTTLSFSSLQRYVEEINRLADELYTQAIDALADALL